MTEHAFTATIREILADQFPSVPPDDLLGHSELLQYLNVKTRSASRGSKARGSFANLYAIYVLVEDYLAQGFAESDAYSDYGGAKFTDLLTRQRELPFGEKLQNHALNDRLNGEFRKYFPTIDLLPILRDLSTNRYWFNEALLKVHIGGQVHNISGAVIEIIDRYVQAKRDAFEQFLETCRRLVDDQATDLAAERIEFIDSLLAPSVDARIFEIVSFAILKAYYGARSVWIGYERESVEEEHLILYKTGRTNANDGGIHFVMRPMGRFYQVTETLDLRKYFLDIDKIQRFPITFVVKSELGSEEIRKRIEEHARQAFTAKALVSAYMEAVEEVITIPELREHLRVVHESGRFAEISQEMITQAKVEFHLTE